MSTTEAILAVLQNDYSFRELDNYELSQVPAIKTAYTEAANNINTANKGTIENKHVLFVYMAGDDRFIYNGMVSQLDALKQAGQVPNTQVLVMFDNYDASGKTEMKISRLSGNNLVELENLGKTDAANPVYLQNFLTKYKRLYPAEKYSLYIGGHANSWKPYENIAPSVRKWLLSDESATYLGTKGNISEIANAIKSTINIFPETSRQYELLIIDACNMASIETVCEFKDTAKFAS